MIVKVKNIPVRHNGQLFGAGMEFEMERADYEKIKQHLDVVDESDKPSKADADPELDALRIRGKELGVKSFHNLGKEKLIAAIAEKEEELAAEEKLNSLCEKATALGVENANDMDADALMTAIAAKDGSGDAS